MLMLTACISISSSILGDSKLLAAAALLAAVKQLASVFNVEETSVQQLARNASSHPASVSLALLSTGVAHRS